MSTLTPTIKSSLVFHDVTEEEKGVKCSVKNCPYHATQIVCRKAGRDHFDYYLCSEHVRQLREGKAVAAGPYLLFPKEHREATQNATTTS